MQETVFDNINPAVLERVRKLRLIDDELMTVVFSGDKKATELLIRILLNRNDLTVTKSMTQVEKHNLYIIFILEHDMFETGQAVYHVNKTLDIKDEDGNNLPFDDGCNIMYINGDYRGDNSLGKLMHDFSTPNADEMYFDELASKVKFHKQDEQGVQMASKIVEEYGDIRAAEALKQGIQQGEEKKAIEVATNLIKLKVLSAEQIAQAEGLPLEKVLELQKQIMVE